MRTTRPSFFAGLFLIFLGIVALLTYFLPNAWPVVLVCIGLFFLVVAVRWRVSWPVVSGLVNGALGGILLYQTLTGNWKSWYYLWPLIFASLGAGLLITDAIERVPRDGSSSRYLRMSWAWLVLGVLSTAALWFFRAQISWPSIIWGIGCMFLLVTLACGIGPLAIPGSIFTGLGLLLAWQNYNQDWASWAFAWALIPASVGLGLVLAFIRSRVMRIIGLSILAWSLVAFAIFGLFFAGQGVMVRLWPAALIMAGLVVLFQAFLTRSPIKH